MSMYTDRHLGDADRAKLRDEKGYDNLVRQTTDALTLKPVKFTTEVLYSNALHEWDLFVKDCEARQLGLRPSPLCAKSAKTFLLFYATGRKGRIDNVVTDSSIDTFWKCFMTAWQRKKGDHFPKALRDTIQNLIRGGEDNILGLSNARRPVRNYTLLDFEAVSRQLWQNDWHDYRHELYRTGLHLLQLLHCSTSGRAAEFEGNLRFRGITVVQVWVTQQPQIVLDLRRDQAKGLQNLPREQPEHLLYELVGQPLYFNAVLFFMARALAAGVFRSYKSWSEICGAPKPSEAYHEILHYDEKCLDMPVFPLCGGDGTVDNSKPSSSLANHALVNLGRRTGFRENLTIHASRREALLEVDNYGYSINERMRFAGHRAQGTYAAAYQPRVSTVDGQATFFGFERQNCHIHQLFRGYSLHRDFNYRPALPERLLSQTETKYSKSYLRACSKGEQSSRTKLQKLYDQRRLERDRFARAGAFKDHPKGYPYESDFSQTRKLMPERDRLAENLFKQASLRDEVGIQVMDDLVQLMQLTKTQTSCANLNSSSTHCDGCGQPRNRDRVAVWGTHVYYCQKSRARKERRFKEFCFLCLQWYMCVEDWERHTAEHLRFDGNFGPLPLKCDIAQFRHHIIRPGLCPSCLGNDADGPSTRFHQYTNVTDWKRHVISHLDVGRQGAHHCPHPRCVDLSKIDHVHQYLHHLADVHQIRYSLEERGRAIRLSKSAGLTSANPKASQGRKRSAATSTHDVFVPTTEDLKRSTKRPISRRNHNKRVCLNPQLRVKSRDEENPDVNCQAHLENNIRPLAEAIGPTRTGSEVQSSNQPTSEFSGQGSKPGKQWDIYIEVPPRPRDWWTWAEISLPTLGDGMSQLEAEE